MTETYYKAARREEGKEEKKKKKKKEWSRLTLRETPSVSRLIYAPINMFSLM